ncbi:hypothetical protein NL154_05710 [Rhizobium sp. YTUHZ044]|uniref:hypothetical protein n=1 Tax=Rhizobium sp. YTUHZ044 TaxID=2962678 RepID=UPI003DA98540
MPRYEVEMNGQRFEVEAPDDQALSLAVKKMQADAGVPQNPPVEGGYSSGPEWTKPITSFGNGITDMATFGFGDEIGAAIDAAGSHIFPWREPKTYEQALEEGRNDQRSLAESNPVSNIAGKVVGGVGSASALARGGLSFAANAPRTAGLGGMVARSAADGALLGGAYGLGSGEDGFLNRSYEAGKGALIGGLIGGAVPIAARGVSSAYRSIMDAIAQNRAAANAGVSPGAARILTNALQADGTLGPRGMQNMARAGQEAMLADAGPNARQVLDTAVQKGGPGGVIARDAIDARVARGADDLTTALDDNLGQPQGVFSARRAIAEAGRPVLRDAYEVAYGTPIDYASQQGQNLENIIRTRIPGNIISQANRLMQLEGNQSQQILARAADDGSVAFETLPDVRQIDYITRALRQASESGEGQGALGGQTQLGSAYQSLAREIRGQLRSLVPEYGNALDTAADSISRSQAVRLGGQALSPSMRTDEFANSLEGMSVAERGAVSQGIRSEIEHRVSQVARTVRDGNTDAREAIKALRDLSSRANRQKVTLAIGEDQANRLFDEIDRIATTFELRAGVAENSLTFARTSTDNAIKDMTAPGPIRTAAEGEPLKAGKRLIQLLTGQTPARLAERQQAIYSELADYLTRPAAQAIPAFQTMTNFGNQLATNQAQARAIAEFLSSAGRRLAYPLSGQSRDKLPDL